MFSQLFKVLSSPRALCERALEEKAELSFETKAQEGRKSQGRAFSKVTSVWFLFASIN